MEYVLIYVALSLFAIMMFIAIFMTKTSDLPYLTRRLTVDLSMSRRLAERIQSVCDAHRQGDDRYTDILIIQIAYQGYVMPDDINQIIEQFPGMLQSPGILRTKCHLERLTFDELLDAMGVVR